MTVGGRPGPGPANDPPGWAVHVAVAIATTWPLAIHLDRLPLGREPTPTVPRFNLWTYRWTAARLPHSLHGWWDAPIFWPNRGTFAWSEPQPLTGLVFAAIQRATGPTAAYGIVLIATLALNGIAGAALARRLGASRPAATLAGILVQAVPFAFDQLGVLQLLALWPVLCLLTCTLAWKQEGRARHALGIGLAIAAGALTCAYLTALAAIAIVPALLVSALTSPAPATRREPQRWGWLALGLAIPAVVAGPVVLGQRRHLAGRRWLGGTITAGSATVHDWLPGNRAGPTVALLALGIAGAWIGRRRAPVRFVAMVGAAAAVVSFGTRLALGPVAPWAWLVDHVSPIGQLRSPYRAAALTQIALAVLAALAIDRLWRWRPRPRPLIGPAAALAVVALAVALARPGAGHLAIAERPAGAWHDRLIELSSRAHATDAVVFLPFAPSPATASFAPTTERMLQNLDTGVPTVNGYSGFFPSDHPQLRADLRGFPDRRSLVALVRHGARWAVVDRADWDGFDARVARTLDIETIVADDDAVLLRLPTATELN